MKQRMYVILKYLILNYAPGPILNFLKKKHYARELKRFSSDREPDLKVVNELVNPGDHVIDIGANVGLYTKALSELVGERGFVYSIEPVPDTFEILTSNIAKLRLVNVLPIDKAISDENGVVTMGIPCCSRRAGNYYRAYITDAILEDTIHIGVQAATIDTLFIDESESISFVKCDVEGHELACLRGAGRFLEKTDAAWLIEISTDPDVYDSPAGLLFQELARKGYAPWWFDGSRLIKRSRGDTSTNYFFLKPKHVKAIRLKDPHLIRET